MCSRDFKVYYLEMPRTSLLFSSLLFACSRTAIGEIHHLPFSVFTVCTLVLVDKELDWEYRWARTRTLAVCDGL